MKRFLAALTLTTGLVGAAMAASGDRAEATLSGNGVSGTVTMNETASGMVQVIVDASGLPEGPHGFHVHETGDCDPATGFKSAGGHFAGTFKHGVETVGGPHPGDFPNIHADANGNVKTEFFTLGFQLDNRAEPSILDSDGSAVIIHAGADDYRSQPSGDAGARLACGVIERQ